MMRKSLLILIFSIVAITVAGCVSRGVVIEDLSTALSSLQGMVVKAMPLGLRNQSINGRVYYSKYFVYQSGNYEEAESAKTRSQAEISILGDRRPYKIQVIVRVEGKNNRGTYELVKEDQGQAQVISRRIQKALYERRDDRNIIDDFRAF